MHSSRWSLLGLSGLAESSMMNCSVNCLLGFSRKSMSWCISCVHLGFLGQAENDDSVFQWIVLFMVFLGLGENRQGVCQEVVLI